MSTDQLFQSFGLENKQEENKLDSKVIDSNKNKRTAQLVKDDQNIFNFWDGEDSLFLTTNPTVPVRNQKLFSSDDYQLKIFSCYNASDRTSEAQTIILNKFPSNIEPSKYKMKNRTNTLSSRFLVKAKEMKEFFRLTEDPVINDFLKRDSCKRIADKYLIAMVFAYFKRAGFTIKDYNRTNFFIALYLANDVEEDEEEIKYEILPWAIGKHWRESYVDFLKKRDLLFKRIEYKAIISRKCCDEIINIEPTHSLWKRERCLHHGGAVRGYMKDPRDNGIPRGPDADPYLCPECDVPDSQYDSASSDSLTWLISPHESFGTS